MGCKKIEKMMNFIRYIVFLFVVALSGCSKAPYDVEINPQDKVYINLSATTEHSVEVETKDAGVVDENGEFGEDKVALYAVKYAKGDVAPFDFTTTNRVINTVTATIGSDVGIVKYGTAAQFPDAKVAVYGLFPSELKNGVEIEDNGGNAAPSAKVTLKLKPLEQYDVMIAKNENLDRLKHPTGTSGAVGKSGESITFEHTLAQLIVSVYADPEVQGEKIVTKVTVGAPGIATLTDITKQGYSNIGADSEFLVNENFSTPINVTTQETAIVVGSPLMLFPGSVTSVNLTIDGNLYTVSIPKSVVLEQGKINTIRLQLTKLGVKFGGITIGKWGDGADGSGNTEVIRRKTAFDIELKSVGASFSATAGAIYTAEAQINDSYWLSYTPPGKSQTTVIPCTVTGSRLKFDQKIETLMMTEDDIFLTKLKIYENGNLIFDGKTSKATPESVKMLINQTTGAVTISEAATSFDVGFGNFGTGSLSFPFEVDNAIRFDNIRKFYTSTRTSVLNFVQAGDIDLAPHLLLDENLEPRSVASGVATLGAATGWIPIAPSNGSLFINYDGKGFAIKGMYIKNTVDKMSLFGAVKGNTSTRSTVKWLNIYGKIQAKLNIGGFAAITEYTDFLHCKTYVDIDCDGSGTTGDHYVGGVVGDASQTSIDMCGSYGKVSVGKKTGANVFVYIGGLVGNFGTKDCEIVSSVSAGEVNVVATKNSNIYAGGDVGSCRL